MAGNSPSETEPLQGFGNCCAELKEALEGDEFEPLLTVGSEGVIYMTVGLIEIDDEDEPGLVDHPMFFCPFCGTKLQTPEDVRTKTGTDLLS